MDAEDYARQIVTWYQQKARPLLEQHTPERVETIDREVSRLADLQGVSKEDLPVCVLGNAGVGKSTLINAMVAGHQTVLPQGGVGPLTAQATLVRYSAERFFKATYLSKRKLNALLFALERYHELQLRQQGVAVEHRSQELKEALSSEEAEEVELEAPVLADPSASTDDSARIQGLRKQAQIIVKGSQFGDAELPYLIDALRYAHGSRERWGHVIADEDRARLDRVKEALARPQDSSFERHAGEGGMASFLRELHVHAAGFLSPLIRTLEVGWDADFLRGGLVLVDLPGLGVANDEYRRVTADWIRKARAVLLVVDRSGVNESSADLLRSTGFLNSLLHESHDPDKLPVHLLVSVVKLDLSADDARNLEKQTKPREEWQGWVSHFDDACRHAVELLRGQVRDELGKIAESGPENTREERRELLDRVRQSLEVHPVSALEFRRFLQQEDDDRPRITAVEQSRIPGIVAALQRLVREHMEHVEDRLVQSATELHTHIASALELLKAQWEQDTRADDEAQRLQEELEQFLAPRREELLRRQSAFREFLRSSVPAQIEARLAEASLSAKEDISKYIRRIESYHWATLRAAVRRGGTYVGAKHVDLPNELTLRFEEPVAVVWSKYILAALRKRTRELGDDYVQLTGEVVEWARGQGTRVQPKLVEALHEDMKSELRELSSVGKEAIDELRERVKKQLYDKVSDRVRKKCTAFVESKRDIGAGVKSRIVGFIHDELVAAVIDAATPSARKVLNDNYERVEKEITSVFAKVKNPLDRAASEIVDNEKARIRRSDAQRRKRVLEQAAAAISSQPKRLGKAPGLPTA